MKTLTDQLRALATAPEFEDTTTAKLFLEIADQTERLVEDKARLEWAIENHLLLHPQAMRPKWSHDNNHLLLSRDEIDTARKP